MELRPDLRRIYPPPRSWWSGRHGSSWDSSPCPVGRSRFAGEAAFPAFLDFGPASVDGWLTRVIATELRVDEDQLLDFAQRQLVVDGRRIDLTKLEAEVLALPVRESKPRRRSVDAAARGVGLRRCGRQQRHRGPGEGDPTQARRPGRRHRDRPGHRYRFIPNAQPSSETRRSLRCCWPPRRPGWPSRVRPALIGGKGTSTLRAASLP